MVNQLPKPLLDLVKYTFYVGALTSYNLLITAMRKDSSLRTMSMVSDQVVNDLNNTFEAMLTSKTH